jgi:hypothetical protein
MEITSRVSKSTNPKSTAGQGILVRRLTRKQLLGGRARVKRLSKV